MPEAVAWQTSSSEIVWYSDVKGASRGDRWHGLSIKGMYWMDF